MPEITPEMATLRTRCAEESAAVSTTAPAPVEAHAGDDYLILRLPETAGLEPGRPRTPLVQRVLDAVMAVPGVLQASLAVAEGKDLGVVVYWVPGADPQRVGEAALDAVRGVLVM